MEQVTSPKLCDIIIPCHNRLELTKQTIESLLKNTDPEKYNLYLVDDVSTDGTREYIYSLKDVCHVFINDDNIGPGASRNFVCNAITANGTRSKYLYHSDNDVFFKPGWLENLIGVFRDPQTAKIKVLGASCHPFLQSSSRIYRGIHPFAVGIKDAVSGYSQLMTWETWDKYGPFDETMRGAEKKIMGSEDWAFCQKIVKDGFLVGSVEPELVIPCGKTNTYGDPATGAETFKNVEGVIVK